MTKFRFQTVGVFTDTMFAGNQLAVFTDAEGLSGSRMQALAREMNLSETAFVLPPTDLGNTARVRIFNRADEMEFAGHPLIGTAYVLAKCRPSTATLMKLEVAAGVVPVEIHYDDQGVALGASIEAPLPLACKAGMPVELVAECLGVEYEDVLTTTHGPVLASMGNPFMIAEVACGALERCEPDVAAFRRAVDGHSVLDGRLAVYVYERGDGLLNARMFAPLAGTWEDAATGSAAAPLIGLLLEQMGGDRLRLEIRQGVKMGRPSSIVAEARRVEDGIRASVGGGCVQMFEGCFIAGGSSQ
jgi:trans-2,3-dihydro-3-hydroxyanthranilate isomerase